jgi:hypothetical protein
MGERMIELYKLTQADIGKWVYYKVNGTIGRIKSWNKRWIFVVYKCDKRWDRYQMYTGCATNPRELEFIPDDEVQL